MKPDQILASLSQLDHQKRPVTLVAIAFFSLVCMSLAGMHGWGIFKARQEQLAAAGQATEAMTRSLGDHVRNGLDQADAALTDLSERMQLDAGATDPLLLHFHMAQRVQRTTLLADLALYDEAGALATTSSAEPAASPATAQHLRHHGADPAIALYIGTPTREAGGRWLLPVSRRLNKSDGSFGGMALAHVRLGVFEDYARSFALGPRGSLSVALNNGTLLVARPAADALVGKNVRSHPAFRLWRAGPASSAAKVHAPGDSIEDDLGSYRRLAPYAVLVSVQQSPDDVLAAWAEGAYFSTAGASVLLLLQMWLGIRLYGQIALRDRLEKERRSLQKLLVKKSRSLRRQALKDGLTGIANRRQLDIRLAYEFNLAARDGTSLALVILDVDYFKNYNDQYGHPAGDECLKFVAGCVNGGRRRSQDLAARMGGEEFAILLPATGLRGAIAVAEAIRKTVAAHKMHHVPGTPHAVTVSCGVHALVPTEGMLPQELVDAADRALYLAKTSGRNRVRAEGSMPPTRTKRFSLVVNK